MPIAAKCGHCGTTYQVSSKFAGQTAKCKKCGKSFKVAAASANTGASAPPAPDTSGELDLAPERGPTTRATAAQPLATKPATQPRTAQPAADSPSGSQEQIYRRKVTFVPLGGLAAALVAVWTFFVLKSVFDFDLLSHFGPGNDKPGEGPSSMLYFWIALAVTVVATPIVLLMVRRNLHLLTHGIEMHASVASAGLGGNSKMGYKGHMPVTFVFIVEGKEYKVRKDVLTSTARSYNSSSQILLRYDPRNPKRCVILD